MDKGHGAAAEEPRPTSRLPVGCYDLNENQAIEKIQNHLMMETVTSSKYEVSKLHE